MARRTVAKTKATCQKGLVQSNAASPHSSDDDDSHDISPILNKRKGMHSSDMPGLKRKYDGLPVLYSQQDSSDENDNNTTKSQEATMTHAEGQFKSCLAELLVYINNIVPTYKSQWSYFMLKNHENGTIKRVNVEHLMFMVKCIMTKLQEDVNEKVKSLKLSYSWEKALQQFRTVTEERVDQIFDRSVSLNETGIISNDEAHDVRPSAVREKSTLLEASKDVNELEAQNKRVKHREPRDSENPATCKTFSKGKQRQDNIDASTKRDTTNQLPSLSNLPEITISSNSKKPSGISNSIQEERGNGSDSDISMCSTKKDATNQLPSLSNLPETTISCYSKKPSGISNSIHEERGSGSHNDISMCSTKKDTTNHQLPSLSNLPEITISSNSKKPSGISNSIQEERGSGSHSGISMCSTKKDATNQLPSLSNCPEISTSCHSQKSSGISNSIQEERGSGSDSDISMCSTIIYKELSTKDSTSITSTRVTSEDGDDTSGSEILTKSKRVKRRVPMISDSDSASRGSEDDNYCQLQSPSERFNSDRGLASNRRTVQWKATHTTSYLGSRIFGRTSPVRVYVNTINDYRGDESADRNVEHYTAERYKKTLIQNDIKLRMNCAVKLCRLKWNSRNYKRL